MSSWAFFSAVLASCRTFTSGFSKSTARSRYIAFPRAGPAQESATGLGLIPVTFHFRQLNSTGRDLVKRGRAESKKKKERGKQDRALTVSHSTPQRAEVGRLFYTNLPCGVDKSCVLRVERFTEP